MTQESRQRNFLFFMDGLKYSFQMARVQKSEIDRLLPNLEASLSTGAKEAEAVSLIMNTWGLVDTANRIRELIQQLPEMKQNDPTIQAFVRATKAVAALRNHVQHLRTEINLLQENTTPLWGVISWVSMTDPSTCFGIFSGTLQDNISVYSCSYDTHKDEFAQKIILSVNDTTVDIDILAIRIEQLFVFWSEWAEKRGYTLSEKPIPVLRHQFLREQGPYET